MATRTVQTSRTDTISNAAQTAALTFFRLPDGTNVCDVTLTTDATTGAGTEVRRVVISTLTNPQRVALAAALLPVINSALTAAGYA